MRTLLLAIAALLVVGAARADYPLTFTLVPSTESGQSGDWVSFAGVLTNTGSDPVEFTGFDITALNSDEPPLDNFDYADLAGGSTELANDMFRVHIGATTPLGPNAGSATLFYAGGPDDGVTANFTFAAVPELPAGSGFTVLLVAGAAFTLARRRLG